MPKRYELREALRLNERRAHLMAMLDPSDLDAACLSEIGETADVLYTQLIAMRLAALGGDDPSAMSAPRRQSDPVD